MTTASTFKLIKYPGLIFFCSLLILFTSCSPTEKEVKPSKPSETRKAVNKEDMVLIPGGTYSLGSGEKNEAPVHESVLEGFYIDKKPVSVNDFYEFCLNTGYKSKEGGVSFPGLKERIKTEADLPITLISLEDARAYAKWAGKRLPTEEEFEAAASGREKTTYPWGEEWSPDFVSLKSKYPHKIGEFPKGATKSGLLDMTGNVFHFTASELVAEEPDGSTRRLPIIRSGAWTYFPLWNHTTFRTKFEPRISPFVGFRCVLPKDPQNDKNLKNGKESAYSTRGQYDNTETLRQLLSFTLWKDRKMRPHAEKYLKENVRKGETVADIGTGLGYLSFRLYPHVGPKGKIYAVDIEPGVLEFLDTVAKNEGLDNIETILSVKDDIKVPEGSCDQVFLLGVLHFFTGGEDAKAFLQSCHKALKPGGKLVVYEFPNYPRLNSVFSMIPKTGFEIVEDKLNEDFPTAVYIKK